MDLFDLDWKDIAIHAAIGAAVGAIATFVIGVPLLLANFLFFFAREAWQRKEQGQPMSALFTHPQVVWEWGAPLVASLITYGIFG